METVALSGIAFIFGCLIASLSVDIIVIDPIRREAIKRGYAYWEVVNESTGRTEFKFK